MKLYLAGDSHNATKWVTVARAERARGVLEWTSAPHRRFTIGVVPYLYAAELDTRSLTSAGDSYSGMMIGWTRRFGTSPTKTLTLVQA